MPVTLLHQPENETSTRDDYHDRFAAAYDTIYRHRDVDGEVEHALKLLGWSTPFDGAPRVLDFGCGTGSHALAMARRGCSVIGLDASPAMIARAQRKAGSCPGTSVAFVTVEPGTDWPASSCGPFDGAVSFFNVLNCMESAGDMVQALSMIRRRLRVGACAYFEVWNGAAVFADLPRPDARHFRSDGVEAREMIRITVPEVCRIEQRCTLRYRVLELDAVRGRYTEFESVHRLHFLTPVQYRHVFALAELEIVDEFPKHRPGTIIRENDWYIAYLVRRG